MQQLINFPPDPSEEVDVSLMIIRVWKDLPESKTNQQSCNNNNPKPFLPPDAQDFLLPLPRYMKSTIAATIKAPTMKIVALKVGSSVVVSSLIVPSGL